MESKRKAWLKRAMDIMVGGSSTGVSTTGGSANGGACPVNSSGSTTSHGISHATQSADVYNRSRTGDGSSSDDLHQRKSDTTTTTASTTSSVSSTSSSSSSSSKFRAVKLICTSRDIPAELSLPSLALQMSRVVR